MFANILYKSKFGGKSIKEKILKRAKLFQKN